MPEGIMVAFGAPEFPIVVVNRMAEQLLGRARGELLGMPAGSHAQGYGFVLRDTTVPAGRAQMPLYRTAHGGETIRDEEWILVREDGRRCVLLVNTNPLRNPAGAIVGAINCMRDVTHLKHVEAALRTSESRLREADRRKDEFLATLAHELRGPLTPIRNAVQILKLRAAGDAVQQNLADMLDRQVTDITRLLDDVLDLSRVAVGKLGLNDDIVELGPVIEHALEWSGPLIQARRHRLAVTIPPHPVRVRGDGGRLAQVVSNLLSNAAKYTDPGGEIAVTLEGSGAHATVRVRDSGRGLEPSDLKNLFDLFHQLDRTLDRAEGGMGIGLSLVRSLVTMHGGEVDAFSAGRGKGSEFVVRLPSWNGKADEESPVRYACSTP